MAKNTRIPTIVVLGHVDHGKTTLLDAIRGTSVQKSEPMGITQNIYISEVNYKGKPLTFVDTPGHEVFSLMRMQGGKVADLALLVVAADEGVKPQTKESLEIIKKEGIKFVVAITKIDVEGADIQKVINQLLAEGVYLEGYGGDVPYVPVSAVTKEGLDKLMETILLYIEVEGILDDTLAKLRLEETLPNKQLGNLVDGYGIVLDTTVDPHMGTTAFVIWRLGHLSNKDIVFIQDTPVRLTKVLDAHRQPIREIVPGKAFILPSLDILPNPGDLVLFGKNRRKLEKALTRYHKELKLSTSKQSTKEEKQSSKEEFLDKFFFEDEDEVSKEKVNLVIKFDVEASKRSVVPTLSSFNNDYVEFRVVSAGVGNVTTSDIEVAKTFGAILVAFRVKASNKVKDIAKKEGVELVEFDTVYQFYEYLQEIAQNKQKQMEAPAPIGKAKVLKIFELSDGSIVAGSVVLEGVVKRSAVARVVRGDQKVAEYPILDLRRFKEKVAEVKKGSECGINLGKGADIKEGDILEVVPV